jgi:hypothetical protein
MTGHPAFEGFNGNKMVFEEDADGSATFKFDDKGIGRSCGDCQLCCRLLPIPPLHKPAGQRCKYQQVRKGCTIYENRPYVCRSWSCRWMADATTAGMPRPDRCHYVIDLSYDTAIMGQDRVSCLQVWIDPNYPDAHKAPELRRYMLLIAEKWRSPTIIRWGSRQAMLVFPPPLTSDGEWHEDRTAVIAPNGERHDFSGVTATMDDGTVYSSDKEAPSAR